MNVRKRDGRTELVMFDKITSRITKLCYALDDKYVNPQLVAQKVITGVYDGVSTGALDDLAAETAAYLTTQHPDYARLAARISVSNLHKMTNKSFSATMDQLHKYVNPRNDQWAPLIADDVHDIIMQNAERLDAALMCALPQLDLAQRSRARTGAAGWEEDRGVGGHICGVPGWQPPPPSGTRWLLADD
eukprot:2776152-Prymnesium_polylepis.1